MGVVRPKYTKEKFAERGEEIYREEICSVIDVAQNDGKRVLIDIETGDYEIDADELAASKRLLARKPQAQVWMRRIGRKGARRFGGRMVKT